MQDAGSTSEMVRALTATLPKLHDAAARRMIGRVRTCAIAEGLMPVAELADGLVAALGRDRRGTPLRAWIDAMDAAALSGPRGGDTAALWLATIGVRLSH